MPQDVPSDPPKIRHQAVAVDASRFDASSLHKAVSVLCAAVLLVSRGVHHYKSTRLAPFDLRRRRIKL